MRAALLVFAFIAFVAGATCGTFGSPGPAATPPAHSVFSSTQYYMTNTNRQEDMRGYLLGGRPAIHFIGRAVSSSNTMLGKLVFIWSDNAEGSGTWPSVQVADFTTFDANANIASAYFAIVNGHPAYAVADVGDTDTMYYARATDAAGTQWPNPMVITGATDADGFLMSRGQGTTLFTAANGLPCVSWIAGSPRSGMLSCATDVNGTTWSPPVTALTGLTTTTLWMHTTVIQNHIVMAAHNRDGNVVSSIGNADNTAFTQAAPLALGADNERSQPFSFLSGDRIGFTYTFDPEDKFNVRYTESITVTGTPAITWGPEVTYVDESNFPSPAGNAAAADSQSIITVHYQRSNNRVATSRQWPPLQEEAGWCINLSFTNTFDPIIGGVQILANDVAATFGVWYPFDFPTRPLQFYFQASLASSAPTAAPSAAPTSAPTLAPGQTASPTTGAPTTASPTTASPTTASPTSLASTIGTTPIFMLVATLIVVLFQLN